MNAFDPAENNVPPLENQTVENKSKIKSRMVWLQSATFLAGLMLLGLVVYKIGFQTVFDALRRVGWGILLIIGLNGARHFLRSLCIYIAIPPQHRAFKYRYALAARFAGEAVSFLTFTGPFLGEATKAALLKNRVPLSHGIAAVVVDNILYDASVALLILGGVGTMFYVYGTEDAAIRGVLLAVAVGAAILVALLVTALRTQVKPLTWLLKKLAARNRLPRFFASKQSKVFELEETVNQFYAHRKKAFLGICGLVFSAHILSVCEVYLALYLLGEDASATTAYIIESLTKIINSVFSFVPGTIGVYEGGNGVILHALGYATVVGLTLALVRRSAILFWTFVGLIILLWRGVKRGSKIVVAK